jgi:hypothetical protein
MLSRRSKKKYTGLFKKKYKLSKIYFTKLLKLNSCPVYGWKGNLSNLWYWWSEEAHHWGCGCCYLWHAVTSLGRAGLSIWHLLRHTWGSHRVLVRCENNFESSPFSLYIARRRMFNTICNINFWKCILFWITLYKEYKSRDKRWSEQAQKNIVYAKIWGSHSDEYEDGCLVGYSTVKSGRYWSTFQRILLLPLSGCRSISTWLHGATSKEDIHFNGVYMFIPLFYDAV